MWNRVRVAKKKAIMTPNDNHQDEKAGVADY